MDEVFRSLRKQMIEGALEAELDAHLEYTKYAPEGRNSGKSRKTLKVEKGMTTRKIAEMIKHIIMQLPDKSLRYFYIIFT